MTLYGEALHGVNDKTAKTARNASKNSERDVRAARLNAALRANLHKRKQQDRDRAAQGDAEHEEQDQDPGGESHEG